MNSLCVGTDSVIWRICLRLVQIVFLLFGWGLEILIELEG